MLHKVIRMMAGKNFKLVVSTFSMLWFLALLFLTTGCPDARFVKYDSTLRQPTISVEVFKNKELPNHPVKVIAELSWKGPRSDELRAENYFVKEAKKMGGNAILVEEPAGGVYSAPRVHGPDGIVWDPPDNNAWLFKAKVAVYE